MYEKTPKSVLIKEYRKMLSQNKSNFTNRYNTPDCLPSLKRPVVTGKSMSWIEFSRLNREQVAVHCFLEGLTIDGVETVCDEEE
tara:strand:- start:791 stop:1042 length:252 start_codon:yes stop_codon:yes gene_type:complete